MATNLKIVRIIGQNDVIAEVVSQTDKVLKLKNAVRLFVFENKTDPKKPTVAMAPFCEFSENADVDINMQHVIALMNPNAEFVNQYNSVFGGIIVPEKNFIVP